ncbi:MAG: type II secretion system minor pseudopilin GspJ [Pseudomonadales bacterium]|nr:type II secretion system minor pseudopilin GspJ [Pseudomonadales bacterium]
MKRTIDPIQHHKQSLSNGFTLIELIVAVAIFAVISLGTFALFQSVLAVKDRTDIQSAALKEIQRGIAIITSDMEQIVQRPIRDQYGDYQRPLVAQHGGEIEFSKAGWTLSPFSKTRRSEIQRVRYTMEEGALVRSHWYVLDRAGDSTPISLPLIQGVTELSFRYLQKDPQHGSQWVEMWPHDGSKIPEPTNPPGPIKYAPDPLPQVIELNLLTERFGSIKRLFRIVAEPPF